MRSARKERRQSGIVCVVTQTFRLGCVQQASHYKWADGSALEPGYYLAIWPSVMAVSPNRPAVRYFGPFATLAEVQLLEASALSLGVVDPALIVQNLSQQTSTFGLTQSADSYPMKLLETSNVDTSKSVSKVAPHAASTVYPF